MRDTKRLSLAFKLNLGNDVQAVTHTQKQAPN